jgi:Tfp pilus assembly protein PilF
MGKFDGIDIKTIARKTRIALAVAGLVVPLLSGCASFSKKPPGDPVKMSKSEVALAADLWQRLGRTREALDHALKAVEYDDQNPDAAHLVALLYLDFCRTSEIGECRLKEAENHARRAISQRENFLEAQNTLAVILIHQKRYTEATKILIPITEDILYGTPEIAWGNLGWAYMGMGNDKLAIPALRRAVAAQPLFCVGSFRLGVAYHRTGAMESAVEALNRALETDAPGCSRMQDAYLERAQVHLALGADSSSRADLDRCLELAKSSPTGRKCDRLMASLE